MHVVASHDVTDPSRGPAVWAAREGAPRALVAEHDGALRRHVADALALDGFVVSLARDGLELVEIVQATLREEGSCPELVVASLHLPGLGGFDGLRALGASLAGATVLVTAARCDEPTRLAARELGLTGVLPAPIDLAALHAVAAGVRPRG